MSKPETRNLSQEVNIDEQVDVPLPAAVNLEEDISLANQSQRVSIPDAQPANQQPEVIQIVEDQLKREIDKGFRLFDEYEKVLDNYEAAVGKGEDETAYDIKAKQMELLEFENRNPIFAQFTKDPLPSNFHTRSLALHNRFADIISRQLNGDLTKHHTRESKLQVNEQFRTVRDAMAYFEEAYADKNLSEDSKITKMAAQFEHIILTAKNLISRNMAIRGETRAYYEVLLPLDTGNKIEAELQDKEKRAEILVRLANFVQRLDEDRAEFFKAIELPMPINQRYSPDRIVQEKEIDELIQLVNSPLDAASRDDFKNFFTEFNEARADSGTPFNQMSDEGRKKRFDEAVNAFNICQTAIATIARAARAQIEQDFKIASTDAILPIIDEIEKMAIRNPEELQTWIGRFEESRNLEHEIGIQEDRLMKCDPEGEAGEVFEATKVAWDSLVEEKEVLEAREHALKVKRNRFIRAKKALKPVVLDQPIRDRLRAWDAAIAKIKPVEKFLATKIGSFFESNSRYKASKELERYIVTISEAAERVGAVSEKLGAVRSQIETITQELEQLRSSYETATRNAGEMLQARAEKDRLEPEFATIRDQTFGTSLAFRDATRQMVWKLGVSIGTVIEREDYSSGEFTEAESKFRILAEAIDKPLYDSHDYEKVREIRELRTHIRERLKDRLQRRLEGIVKDYQPETGSIPKLQKLIESYGPRAKEVINAVIEKAVAKDTDPQSKKSTELNMIKLLLQEA